MNDARTNSRMCKAAIATLLSFPFSAAVAQCEPQWLSSEGTPGLSDRSYLSVNAMTMWDPDGAGPRLPLLIVGGRFDSAGGVEVSNIAAYDPTTGQWSDVGGGMDSAVLALTTLANGDLIAGGQFIAAGNQAAGTLARWNGVEWAHMGLGTGNAVHSVLALPDGGLVVGGEFSFTAAGFFARVARWDGSQWSALGTGMPGNNDTVRALLLLPNGDIVAGGTFSVAGGVPAHAIARWNGTEWSAIGNDDLTQTGHVFAMVLANDGSLIANGGSFNIPGVEYALGIARWDGEGWSELGGGALPYGRTLLNVPNGDIIAGGGRFYSNSGEIVATGVGRWNGAEWSPLGSGLTGVVHAAALLPNGEIAVGGQISIAGDPFSIGFARFGSPCHCRADLDNDGNFANGGTRDGAVTIDDLIYFLVGFEAGSIAIDLDDGSNTGTPDGAVNVSDVLFCLTRFEVGC